MKKINYSKTDEITVKNQKELDSIPDDFRGRIYIAFGTLFNRAVVRKRYLLSVVARGNSSVEAWENSSVVARGNSSVVAWGNSSVVAWENVQIVKMSLFAKLKTSGKSRIVEMPKSVIEFLDFYGIRHTKTKAIMYKAVRKTNNGYVSDYDNSFCYEIGKIKKETCDNNVFNVCSNGIHIAHLNWALSFGRDWKDLAILEVESKISDIVLPVESDGKVRTCQIKVLRELPLEECGLYGKIIARRKNQ